VSQAGYGLGFELRPTHFSKGGGKFCKGGFAPLVTGVLNTFAILHFRSNRILPVYAKEVLLQLFVSLHLCYEQARNYGGRPT